VAGFKASNIRLAETNRFRVSRTWASPHYRRFATTETDPLGR
jgi:hypothetical protein